MSDANGDRVDEARRGLLAALSALGVGITGAAPHAAAQDAVQMQPRSYRVTFENDRIRVLQFVSKPGLGVCGDGMHSHPAHLTVALSAGRVRIRRPDGTTSIGKGGLGDVFWSEAETHETENISGSDILALIVELKPSARA